MAHVILTVSSFEVADEFYRKLLPEFGMKSVFDGDKLFCCVGARRLVEQERGRSLAPRDCGASRKLIASCVSSGNVS
jgi:hypothetical protein